jgi:EAL domain-containing protein (putative c-di-GMP-specific phosphodiesterase class I)
MKGFRLAMDNFGTGYSTLLEMVRLPFDEIKIDRRFVRRIGESRDSGVVVTSAITLAHGLGMTVCAEGVEDERALEFLRNAGCESAQGRALQAPVPGSEIANLLKQHRFAAKTTERVVSKELPRERFLGGDGGGPLLRPVQHGGPNGMDDSSGN